MVRRWHPGARRTGVTAYGPDSVCTRSAPVLELFARKLRPAKQQQSGGSKQQQEDDDGDN